MDWDVLLFTLWLFPAAQNIENGAVSNPDVLDVHPGGATWNHVHTFKT